MNERMIIELATKANLGPACESQAIAIKKFAELIVQECVKVIEDSPWKLGNSYKATDQAWLIKEHFGVEE